MDEQWWSIEVHDGARSAASWRDSYRQALVEAAVTNGALDWDWRERDWGVVLEIRFRDGERWETFRSLPAVRAALDAVPDPIGGLLVYPGRGGGAGAPSRLPRRPRPGGGAAPMPAEPEPVVVAGHPESPRVPPELALAG